jgi:hypothetical protein
MYGEEPLEITIAFPDGLKSTHLLIPAAIAVEGFENIVPKPLLHGHTAILGADPVLLATTVLLPEVKNLTPYVVAPPGFEAGSENLDP